MAAASLMACGGSEDSEATDGGDANDVGATDVDTQVLPDGPDGGGSVLLDGGVVLSDAATDSSAADAEYVDAGYYYGDGSYWVDGGAYPPVPDASLQDATGGGGDTGAGDASTGCGALSACCDSLSGGSQSLCNTVAASGDETNCAAEMSQLQSGGNCTGVTILASQVQVPANRIVSDGTTLFFTTFEGSPGLLAMPVGGGEITTLVSAEAGDSASFLVVDDVNVYVLEGNSLIRIPKNGDPPTLLSEPGAMVSGATSLGGTAYWVETLQAQSGMIDQPIVVKSTPLLGGAITTLASFVPGSPDIDQIGVTSSAVFIGLEASTLFEFSMGATPASGATAVTAGACGSLSSDTDAVYCTQVFAEDQRTKPSRAMARRYLRTEHQLDDDGVGRHVRLLGR